MNASRSSANDETEEKDQNLPNSSELSLPFDESVLQLIDGPFELKVDSSRLRTDIKYNGFDSTMGNTWIYPTNYPVRQYQHNISRVSLFKNTLVSKNKLHETQVKLNAIRIILYYIFYRLFYQLV